MNTIRTGRTILFLLPYALLVAGLLTAAKTAGSPNGVVATLQALGIAAAGTLWACLRARRSTSSPSPRGR
ncbi:hypothetical protein [Streptomyces sp. B6B3]|uniref:hypothetical protein n=1 Tax=Streptomyces sp. B6B3 TaxID=3153570 RepID=UPI00325E2FE7